jgi:hypothetical protein
MMNNWKAIGQSAIGTAHTASGKSCEDALRYSVIKDSTGNEALICCVADGAGSASHALQAATYATAKVIEYATLKLAQSEALTESIIYALAEDIYDGLQQQATDEGVELNEYSCTFLGCIITSKKAAFFQVGDGAIVRNDGSGFYNTVWWPHNGEYQNTTSFLVDDNSFSQLNIAIIDAQVDELAVFTDGLQLLILTTEDNSVHQPFFNDMLEVDNLNKQLAAYLDGTAINSRTDDDKTLFLATRIVA